MSEYRDGGVKYHGLNLIVKINEDARAGRGAYADRGPIGYDTVDPVTVTHELKTVALQQVMAEHKWDALITGIRRDEDRPGPRSGTSPRGQRISSGTTRISRRS